MKHVRPSLATAIGLWLSVLAILAGPVLMPSAAGADRLCAWLEASRANQAADPSPQAPELLPNHPFDVLLGAVQPGRRGVTEQSGRRSVIEQEGRPTPAPDYIGRERMPPGGRLRPIIVEALLNRQISVSLMLDTGASYTVLTRQTAQDLGITRLDRLPKQPFLTPGGPIQSPVTTLKSIRVGTVEAREVAVAIDVEGHLPIGLLGMTFLRHFKVTVDQAQGQVRFDRR